MELTPELWRRVKGIASDALDRPEAERDAFVATVCGGDELLRREVASLLHSTAAAGTARYLELPPIAASPLPPGTRIGAYRLVGELGAGGMGAVYLARRDDGAGFDQQAAIKVVRGGFAGAFLFQRFREERRILASLEHPNIARLLDGGASEQGVPYVVMEYVDGEPIDVFCRTERLPLARRLEVFCQVCAAVQYAHQRLVIHRDIKCGNVLVTPDGVPKLLDFGIAKLLTPDAAGQTLTIERVMTPESASPEQLRGEAITVAADVYTLGVLLYRILTGQSPYGELPSSEAALIRAVCEHTPEPPGAVARRHRDAALPDAIPADVDLIVMKALRKEPARRYGSAAELADDIRRFLSGRPVLAAPDTFRYRAGKFMRRNRAAVVAAAAVIVALSAGVVTTSWQARVARQQRARAEREFNAVRTLASAVLGELHDAVTPLAGSTKAREILLRRATEYLDTLSADAAGDSDLRRELARGYRRLAQVQGFAGMENLGDSDAARRSLEKGAALLEPIAGGAGATPHDRVELADMWVHLADMDRRGRAPTDGYDRARRLLEGLPAADRSTSHALSVEQALWYGVANAHVAKKDYAAARDAYANEVRAAEAVFRQSPTDLDASRNLSISYKQLGATLEMLSQTDDAIERYRRAMALDRVRVEREPGRPGWRLDLSFSYGAIGAALQSKGDLAGALEQYRQAVDLRRGVVADDPHEDFAQLSLARGYARLAIIAGRMGDEPAAIDWHAKRLDVLGARAAAHLDRPNAWSEYAAAAVEAIGGSVELLEKGKMPQGARRAAVTDVRAMLEQFHTLDARRRHSNDAARAEPPKEEIGRLEARIADAISRGAAK